MAFKEAAAELADPAAYPLLLGLRDEGWAESDPRGHVLTDALSACALRSRWSAKNSKDHQGLASMRAQRRAARNVRADWSARTSAR